MTLRDIALQVTNQDEHLALFWVQGWEDAKACARSGDIESPASVHFSTVQESATYMQGYAAFALQFADVAYACIRPILEAL